MPTKGTIPTERFILLFKQTIGLTARVRNKQMRLEYGPIEQRERMAGILLESENRLAAAEVLMLEWQCDYTLVDDEAVLDSDELKERS